MSVDGQAQGKDGTHLEGHWAERLSASDGHLAPDLGRASEDD